MPFYRATTIHTDTSRLTYVVEVKQAPVAQMRASALKKAASGDVVRIYFLELVSMQAQVVPDTIQEVDSLKLDEIELVEPASHPPPPGMVRFEVDVEVTEVLEFLHALPAEDLEDAKKSFSLALFGEYCLQRTIEVRDRKVFEDTLRMVPETLPA